MQSFWVLTFRVAELQAGIRADQVQEIIPFASTTKVPGQPSILEGFLNLRGDIVPVVPVAALFDLPYAIAEYSPVIIVRIRGIRLGLLAEVVESVVTVDSGDLHPVPSNFALNECAESSFTVEEHDCVLLDCDRLLLFEETRRITELQGRIDRRLSLIGAERS
jgi:purine-binding chemotaxis protein CheW